MKRWASGWGAHSPFLVSTPAAGGQKVPDSVRQQMESRLGVSLEDVRVHTDAEAQKRARDVDAKAFTEGKDVYFDSGKFDPSTETGRRLLAHELVHVVQQKRERPRQRQRERRTATASGEVTQRGQAVEKEADRIADGVVLGRGPAAAGGEVGVRERSPAGTIARDPAPAGALTGNWDVNLLGQQIHADLSTAQGPDGGRKKLTLTVPKIGPVQLDELSIEVDGTSVSKGYLKATIEDGALRGAQAELQITKDGQVSGLARPADQHPRRHRQESHHPVRRRRPQRHRAAERHRHRQPRVPGLGLANVAEGRRRRPARA